ncbi:protein phosphatase 2C domain-containing protein [Streptomyces cacaoi]|uniref:protein phosphatase 2C domain-containing protein n=1 Tax=Streptomyces cacaoi TaxID=1898 RepID=UPI00331B67FF
MSAAEAAPGPPAAPAGEASGDWCVLRQRVKGPGKKVNQDACHVSTPGGGQAVVLAVADGHGSAAHFRSEQGARWAVEEFARCAGEFAHRAIVLDGAGTGYRELRDAARALPRQLVGRWRRRALLADCNAPADGRLPPRPEQSGHTPAARFTPYGSTLVGAVVTANLLVCWQLGDGDVVLVDERGTVRTPLSTGPDLGDETDSLCQPEAGRLVRLHWQAFPGAAEPPAVLLSTDGLAKSFADDAGFQDFAKGVVERAAEHGARTVQEQLPEWLGRAAGYSGDDTTLVAALRSPRRRAHSRAAGGARPEHERNTMVNGMLEAGQILMAESGEQVKVAELFGSGGQGEVYRVETPDGDRALKWYYPQLADDRQRQILEGLIGRGWHDDRFLWPRAVVLDPRTPHEGFGYLMEVRPDRFRDLPALFRRDASVRATTQRSLVTAALHTVEAYRTLHSKGIAYRDINWGNIFFDPATGDVLVCDNDNAVVEGETAAVAGTMDFMAPELVRGDKGAQPGIQSDLHSLAVLLFLLLVNHHPLEGARALRIRCMDEAAKRQLYGSEPVFLFDPSRSDNRPDPDEQPGVLDAWELLPEVLRTLFVKTFTQGLADPGARVRETQWRDALSTVLDSIAPCATCGQQNMTQPGGRPPRCWDCGDTLRLPPTLALTTGRLRVARSVLLGPRAKVYAHHLADDPPRHDFTDVVGEVTEHPKQPGRYGLTNRSGTVWTVRLDDGTVQDVAPGRTAALRPGLLLEFGGGTEAQVRV